MNIEDFIMNQNGNGCMLIIDTGSCTCDFLKEKKTWRKLKMELRKVKSTHVKTK